MRLKHEYKDNEESNFIPSGSLQDELQKAYDKGVDDAIGVVNTWWDRSNNPTITDLRKELQQLKKP